MTGSKISTSCKKVKVNPWRRQSGVFYFRTELSDFNQFEELVYLIVLVYANIPKYEKEPLIAVKRYILQYI